MRRRNVGAKKKRGGSVRQGKEPKEKPPLPKTRKISELQKGEGKVRPLTRDGEGGREPTLSGKEPVKEKVAEREKEDHHFLRRRQVKVNPLQNSNQSISVKPKEEEKDCA